jgi:hypothetical protein
VVTGKTYDVKEVLKAAGAYWASGTWIFRNRQDVKALQEEICSGVESAAAKAAIAAKEAKAYAKWLQTPDGKKYSVQQAVQQGVTWICCESCEVVDWKRQHTYCLKHAEGGNAFRVRGSIYTGD